MILFSLVNRVVVEKSALNLMGVLLYVSLLSSVVLKILSLNLHLSLVYASSGLFV